MAVYRISHVEPVWERSSWTVEADSEEEARERFYGAHSSRVLEWSEVDGGILGMDDEIESITYAKHHPDHEPAHTTCGNCGNSWCERCDPAPAALCHWCHGRGYSNAPLPDNG